MQSSGRRGTLEQGRAAGARWSRGGPQGLAGTGAGLGWLAGTKGQPRGLRYERSSPKP
jgi:hypothetical protein